MDNLWEVGRATAAYAPDHVAFKHGEHATTFRELWRLASGYSEALKLLGVQRRDRVLIWMNASSQMAAAVLAVWTRGGVAALLGPETPAVHLQHAVDLIKPSLVLLTPDLELPFTQEVRTASTEEIEGGSEEGAFLTGVLPTDPASIVFTSGSTGRPKGVTQTHASLLAGCEAVAGYLGYRRDERLLCPIPWHFDYGYGQLLSTLRFGLTQIIPNNLSPFGICEAIEAHRPTVFPGVPSVFTNLFRGVSPLRRTDTSSIRLVTNTGGSIPKAVLNDMLNLFADKNIVLNYGLTETYRTSYLDPALTRERPDSIGKPIPGVDVVIVRADGTLADTEEEGEIVHRGAYMFSGYWNDPKSTAKVLRPDPVLSASPSSSKAVFTGDCGVIDREGFLHFRGRRDRQLKSMGVRVNPSEVEEILYESKLLVEAAVFGQKHDLYGDEMWAAVVAKDGVDRVEIELKSLARTAMSPYMQPRRYLIKDQLPKTSNGKVDYEVLRREASTQTSASLSRI